MNDHGPIFRFVYALSVTLTFAIPVLFIGGAIIIAYPAILAVVAVLGVVVLLVRIFRR